MISPPLGVLKIHSFKCPLVHSFIEQMVIERIN